MLGSLVVGFLTAVLYCAVIILVAFAFVWVMQAVFGIAIEGNVYKWGKIVVGLLCAIILLTWLLGTLGLMSGAYIRPIRIGML